MRAPVVHPDQLALAPVPRRRPGARTAELDLLREAVLTAQAEAELTALPHAAPCRCGPRAWGHGRHCCRCGRDQQGAPGAHGGAPDALRAPGRCADMATSADEALEPRGAAADTLSTDPSGRCSNTTGHDHQ